MLQNMPRYVFVILNFQNDKWQKLTKSVLKVTITKHIKGTIGNLIRMKLMLSQVGYTELSF